VKEPEAGHRLEAPPDLDRQTIPVTPYLQRTLGIAYVQKLNGPILHAGVPLSPGEVTVEFRAPESGLYGELRYWVDEDRRTLRSITRLQNDRREIHSRDLRTLPLEAINNEVQKILNRARVKNPDVFEQSFERFADAKTSRPGRGRVLSDLHLLEVAVKYSQLRLEKNVYGLLKESLGCSASHARNQVAKARKAGLLEQTRRGRPNFNLTQHALELIEEHRHELPDVGKE